ncbi:MAG: phosphatidylserine decarboxylase, partial [Proteobacteria bacterium]|nr:phosphatidylserine decarboxylase [Pseudomonadota bacterium]
MNNLLYLIPKNLLSLCFGIFARVKFPASLMRLILNTYIKFYRVELSDVVKSVDEFRSLAEFFNRELKAGVRPIHATLVSPVDGNITEFGKIEGDKLLQVKGKYYNLYSLLKNNEVAANYLGGYFVTIYLSPADYHNIHS